MTETRRDSVRRAGDEWHQSILSRRLDGGVDDADRGDAFAATIEDGRGNAGDAAEELFAIERIPLLPDRDQLLEQIVDGSDGVWGELRQYDGCQERGDLVGWQMSEERLAGRGGVEKGLAGAFAALRGHRLQ